MKRVGVTARTVWIDARTQVVWETAIDVEEYVERIDGEGSVRKQAQGLALLSRFPFRQILRLLGVARGNLHQG